MALAIHRQIITRPNIIMQNRMRPQHRRAKIIRVAICAMMRRSNVVIRPIAPAIKRIQVLNAKRRCQRGDVIRNGNGTAFEGIQRTVECRHKVYKEKITNECEPNQFIRNLQSVTSHSQAHIDS